MAIRSLQVEGKAVVVDAACEPSPSLSDDYPSSLVDGAPDDLLCPISCELMTDPVFAMDGITYQRAAIQQHIDYCHSKCMHLDLVGRRDGHTWSY